MNASMYVPEDVPFDERLFESNSLLKQYWQNSVTGRSNMAQWATQRSAEEEDLRVESMALYDQLVETVKATPVELPVVAAAAPVDAAALETIVEYNASPIIEEPAEPVEFGPIVKPLGAGGAPAWAWAVMGVLIGLLVIVLFINRSSIYNGFFGLGGAVRRLFRNPVPNVIRMRGGTAGTSKSYDF